MNQLQEIKDRFHSNAVTRSDLIWLFGRIEELQAQLEKVYTKDISALSCEVSDLIKRWAFKYEL